MNQFELAHTFLNIADKGSIQKAAQKLDQSEAAVSKKLKKLEAWLGVQLIIRKRSGLLLTPEGQQYYQETRKAIEYFLNAEMSLRQKKKAPEGTLTVVSNDYYFREFILPRLPAFSKKYPKILLNIQIAEVLPHFKDTGIDIVFGGSAVGEDNMVRKRLCDTRYVLCASPHYLKKQGLPQAPAELFQHHFIAHASRNPPNRIVLDNEEALLLTPSFLMNNTSMMIEVSLQHLGFIWTHENLVATHLEQKTLVTFLSSYTQQSWPVYAYYDYQTHINPCIKVFMEFFASKA